MQMWEIVTKEIGDCEKKDCDRWDRVITGAIKKLGSGNLGGAVPP